MICLSCTGKTVRENLDQIELYRKYIGIAEIRADYLERGELEKLSQLPDESGIPLILTFRRMIDGGVNPEIDEIRRCQFLRQALKGGYGYIDIEDDVCSEEELLLLEKAVETGTGVIRSFHDFNGVPGNVFQRMLDAADGGRFIPKAAVMPRSTDDFLRINGVLQPAPAD